MRSALLCGALLLFAGFTRQPPPACGEAALAVAPEEWDATSAMSGDFTLDGNEDVVFWQREGNVVMLYIASCNGDRPLQTWRFRVTLTEDCPPSEVVVRVAPLLMDAALVERVCASGETEECQHMRLENRRRQALVDAGGRELRVGGRTCSTTRLRWLENRGGFMRIGG